MHDPSDTHENPGGSFSASEFDRGTGRPPIADYLPETTLAEKLGISRRTLQAWRGKGGGPPFVKVGAAVRYRWRDVEAWLDEQTRANTSDPGPRAA